VAIIAAGALAFDAHPEVSAFLRTRVSSVRRLLIPKFTVNAVSVALAFVLGSVVANVLTRVLIGPVPITPSVEGALLWMLYLTFVVAVVALAASLATSQLAVVLLSLGSLIALGVVALVKGVGPWMPSYLVGAPEGLLRGVDQVGDFARAVAATVVLTAALVWLAGRRLAGREL
jgi:ABC-2 type transport system permease protein